MYYLATCGLFGRDFQGLIKVSMITLLTGEVFERHHLGIFPRHPQKH